MEPGELRDEAIDQVFVGVDRRVPGLHLGIQPYGRNVAVAAVTAVADVLAAHGYDEAAKTLLLDLPPIDNVADWLASLAGTSDS